MSLLATSHDLLSCDINEMNWFFLAVALVLVATWTVLHFVFAISLGVLNLLWMIAVVFVVLWGVQSLKS